MSCLSSDDLLEFAAGKLGDERAKVVERHIDDCQDCRRVLSNLVRGDIPPRLGRYRLDTVLGAGGMGIVYRGWDPQLARAVAIKVVKRMGDDEHGRARLVREAQSLARLSHPNVCHVYDVGNESEEVWVAMELIDGVTLRAWASGGRAQHEIIEILLGAAEGIAAAHAVGLIHRDVKPENVLVTRADRPIVTDFGLAHVDDVVDVSATTASMGGAPPQLTASGVIMGTPAYLAPEQLAGEVLDARVDQFAWAVMAWEILTATRPFPTVLALRLEAIRAGVTPPAGMAAGIAAALHRAMAVAPGDRFPTMRELIDAMRAPPPSPPVADPPARPRRRGRLAAIVGGITLASGGVALATMTRSHDGQALPAVVQPTPKTPPIAALERPSPPAAALPSSSPPPSSPQSSPPSPPSSPLAPSPSPQPPPSASPPPRPRPSSSVPARTAPRPASAGTVAVHPTGTYHRGNAIATMSAFCYIPFDAAHPGPSIGVFMVMDWGKVTKVEQVPGQLGDTPITLEVIEIAGQRGRYRVKNGFGALGYLDSVKPGDLLALCPEDDDNNVYQLAGGPLMRTHQVVPISAPPRTAEFAHLAPRYVSSTKLRVAAEGGKLEAGHYLVRERIGSADGDRFEVEQWWIDGTQSAVGANQIATGKMLWLVVSDPRFEPRAGEAPRLVLHVDVAIEDLFP